MTTRLRVGSMMVLSVFGSLLVSCAESGKAPADTGKITPAASEQKAPSQPDFDHVISLATTYKYAATLLPPAQATAPIDKSGKNKGVPRSQDPGLTYARAEKVAGTVYPLEEEVLLKIHADRAYPGLGIAQGDNYVWRSKTSSGVWLVSDRPRDGVPLKRGSTPYSGGNPKEARLVREDFSGSIPVGDTLQPTPMVAFGVCLDDPVLCGGHCGYSQ